MPTFALIIPVRNAGDHAEPLLDSLSQQSIKPTKFIVVDSSSIDHTRDVFLRGGATVSVIPSSLFDHGRTRQMAVELAEDVEVFVLLTQDAILADAESIQILLEPFSDPEVGAAYGRQLPRPGAGPFEAHPRLFNYPPESQMKSFSDSKLLGIKTAFISNSFAAYRRKALESVGGFPQDVILSEDTYVAANMLLSGWKLAYCAEAKVYHSHNYNFRQEFQRYFDIGVFHARQPWVRETFGKAEGEGGRFVRSELSYLVETAPWLLPAAVMRTFLKYLGFRAGLLEKVFPCRLKRRMSIQKAFWDQEILRISNAE